MKNLQILIRNALVFFVTFIMMCALQNFELRTDLSIYNTNSMQVSSRTASVLGIRSLYLKVIEA